MTDVLVAGSVSKDRLLQLTASAERGSEHPFGQAIVLGAKESGLTLLEAEQFDSLTGRGIKARWRERISLQETEN